MGIRRVHLYLEKLFLDEQRKNKPVIIFPVIGYIG